MMRRLILAGTVLALAAGVTASAMASDQKAGQRVSHVGRSHAAASAADLPASAAQRAGILAAGARVTTVVLSTLARLG